MILKNNEMGSALLHDFVPLKAAQMLWIHWIAMKYANAWSIFAFVSRPFGLWVVSIANVGYPLLLPLPNSQVYQVCVCVCKCCTKCKQNTSLQLLPATSN